MPAGQTPYTVSLEVHGELVDKVIRNLIFYVCMHFLSTILSPINLLHLILSIMTIFREGDAGRQSECDRCVPGQHPSLQP